MNTRFFIQIKIVMAYSFLVGLIVYCLGCDSGFHKQSAPRGNATAVSPYVKMENTNIDLGVIAEDIQEIVGVIPISNCGSRDLIIQKVSGSCVCFSGYSGTMVLPPQQKGYIEVKFDKNKLPLGKLQEMVRIETNDPNQPTTDVYFTFDIQRSAEQEQNRILQSELAQLRSEIRSLRRDVDQLKKQPPQQSASASKAAVEDTKIYDIPAGNSPVLGSKDAAVTIVEFSDFQCPYCIKEYPTLKQILSDYPGKVRLVFKHFPLGFHKQAPAVGAMMALALQQKGNDTFWKLHEMIMAEPKKLEPAVLKVYAQALGMDTAELDKVWSDEKAMAELLKADKDLAAKCNVGGTPTIFINGLKLADRSLDGYRGRINRLLSSQGNVVSRAK